MPKAEIPKEGAVERAAAFIESRLQNVSAGSSRIGVVLGSGLGHATQGLRSSNGVAIPYREIPGMPTTSVAGHAGEFIAGHHGDSIVFMLKGRVQFYEGHSLETVTFATRVLHQLGVSDLILTNAAGGIHPHFQTGDLMLISSHVLWPSMNPFTGQAGESKSHFRTEGSTSQQSLSAVESQDELDEPQDRKSIWSARLRQVAASIPCELQVHQGVYAMMCGPNYETPAEVRAARHLGADAVGMSTVPEAFAASALGMSVLGISCITNIASGLSDQKLDHADVTLTSARVEREFSEWLWKVISRIAEERSATGTTNGGS